MINNIIANYKKKNQISGKTKDKIGIFNLSNSKNCIYKIKTPYVVENSQIISKEKGFPDDILYDIQKIPVTENITTIYTSLIQTENIESFTYKTAKIIAPEKETKVSSNSIENKNIRLTVKNNKIKIENLKSKISCELKLTDIDDIGDSYNSVPSGNYQKLQLLKTKVLEDGNIESSLGLYFKNIILKANLNNKSEFIKFEAEIKNKRKNHKLQAVFVLNEKIYETISDEAIGITKRKINPDYLLKDNLPAKYPTELKTNSYPMQNFVSADNLSVMTKGLNEYEIYKNELRICLLRATGTISNPKNPARAIPAGPDLKCTDSQYINKTINCEFGLLFENYIGAYKNIDLFNEIYAPAEGYIAKDNEFRLTNTQKDSYIYGISHNKKISYNIIKREISMY